MVFNMGEQQLLDVFRRHDVDEVIVIYTSKIDVKEAVAMKCFYGCKNQGINWCCPSVKTDISKTRNLLDEYRKAVLAIGSVKKGFRQRVLDAEKELAETGHHRAFALFNGPCDFCKKCAKPNQCLYPSKKRPSLEGLGIDALATLRKFKKNAKQENGDFLPLAIVLVD